ncbi:CgeB family protein [Polluticoccus soli]|uniref:CgeB family protein n=1 Tax=Polluticoccus soli TaxID=3034150 RepID=UPI0023E2C8C4|nr:glycosyltransferase [Flavipsychrobacter sp. JY13-12]
MRILCVGPIWRGSNAGGMFRALSREGHLIDTVDEYYYISFHASNITSKVVQRSIRHIQVNEFNQAIKTAIDLFRPDVVFVYKGRFVQPETLDYARSKGKTLALFYPDVSMKAHGKYIPLNIPRFDIVFTTKTFGITDLKNSYGVTNAQFIPHGFDPDIHRQYQMSDEDLRNFGCDVSFIGTYSQKKENILAAIKKALPEVHLKIWGGQWERCTSPLLQDSIQHTSVLGDLYAIAIQCSKINLGILSEQVVGASSGDLITSRTFHIPGSSGFMLHERNVESLQYFAEDEEAGFFDDAEDIAAKVKRYLSDNGLRERVRLAGYQRALRDHSLDKRAQQVASRLSELVSKR